MIHKIERLAAIGKFHDYTATGNVTFNKLTLFYADNGIGKTTLTSVIRSMANGDINVISRRKTTGSTLQQAARIVQRVSGADTTHTFRLTGWSNPFPHIEIFDTHFVSENIFSGFDFSEDHKKQLYQFVIGAQGVAIQQQIEQNKQAKTTTRQVIDNIVGQIVQQVGNNLTAEMLNAFLALQQNVNITQAITDAEINLTNARANNIIQALRLPGTIPTIHTGINFDQIIADLQHTTQTISDSALEKLFRDHCSDLSKNAISYPENWLRTGFNYIKSKETDTELACPFCKEKFDLNSDIFTAYIQKFNDELNALITRLQNHSETVSGFNLEAIIQSIENILQTNSDAFTAWTTHLPTTVQTPSTVIFSNTQQLHVQFNAVIEAIRQKQQNPSLPVDPLPLTEFQTSGQTVNSNIADYNTEVNLYNTSINSFKAAIQGIPQAQNEVDRLKRNEKRFDTAIVALCTQYQNEKQNLRTLDAAYPILVQQQEAAAATFFTTYRDTINHYLTNIFKTPFRIDNVVHIPPLGRGTQSRMGYTLTINGQQISFNPADNHNAKDSLSDGDKSTLALAFFLAKLDVDPNKADKIVVFDDPLSSFDRNRRLYTVRILTDLLRGVKQVVVLSHNEHFLHEIYKGIAAAEKKTLHIVENFTTKASSIAELDLDALVRVDYFKHLDELQTFLTAPDITKKEEILGKIRNILEACLRFRFYRQINGNSKTLGSIITDVDNSGINFRDANRADVLGALRLLNGVSAKPHHGEPTPDYNVLGIDPTTITVTELANCVQDALNLIDTRI
ncbi:MAG: AAA family ATPase [Bacteroidetes bacterium]|nr:AAA family ATPase [Bacteroidota bacterium]